MIYRGTVAYTRMSSIIPVSVRAMERPAQARLFHWVETHKTRLVITPRGAALLRRESWARSRWSLWRRRSADEVMMYWREKRERNS